MTVTINDIRRAMQDAKRAERCREYLQAVQDDMGVGDLSKAGSAEIAAITRHRTAQDAVTPSQASAEVRKQERVSPVYMVIVAIIFTAICALGAAIAAQGVIAAVTAPTSGCTIEGCPE